MKAEVREEEKEEEEEEEEDVNGGGDGTVWCRVFTLVFSILF